jgi:hypothetical protein
MVRALMLNNTFEVRVRLSGRQQTSFQVLKAVRKNLREKLKLSFLGLRLDSCTLYRV